MPSPRYLLRSRVDSARLRSISARTNVSASVTERVQRIVHRWPHTARFTGAVFAVEAGVVVFLFVFGGTR